MAELNWIPAKDAPLEWEGKLVWRCHPNWPHPECSPMHKAHLPKDGPMLIALAEPVEKPDFGLEPYPDRWRVGQRVIWIRGDQYGYTVPGMVGSVVRISPECKTKRGGEYQVFWCSPDDSDYVFWTTPDDVRPFK